MNKTNRKNNRSMKIYSLLFVFILLFVSLISISSAAKFTLKVAKGSILFGHIGLPSPNTCFWNTGSGQSLITKLSTPTVGYFPLGFNQRSATFFDCEYITAVSFTTNYPDAEQGVLVPLPSTTTLPSVTPITQKVLDYNQQNAQWLITCPQAPDPSNTPEYFASNPGSFIGGDECLAPKIPLLSVIVLQNNYSWNTGSYSATMPLPSPGSMYAFSCFCQNGRTAYAEINNIFVLSPGTGSETNLAYSGSARDNGFAAPSNDLYNISNAYDSQSNIYSGVPSGAQQGIWTWNARYADFANAPTSELTQTSSHGLYFYFTYRLMSPWVGLAFGQPYGPLLCPVWIPPTPVSPPISLCTEQYTCKYSYSYSETSSINSIANSNIIIPTAPSTTKQGASSLTTWGKVPILPYLLYNISIPVIQSDITGNSLLYLNGSYDLYSAHNFLNPGNYLDPLKLELNSSMFVNVKTSSGYQLEEFPSNILSFNSAEVSDIMNAEYASNKNSQYFIANGKSSFLTTIGNSQSPSSQSLANCFSGGAHNCNAQSVTQFCSENPKSCPAPTKVKESFVSIFNASSLTITPVAGANNSYDFAPSSSTNSITYAQTTSKSTSSKSVSVTPQHTSQSASYTPFTGPIQIPNPIYATVTPEGDIYIISETSSTTCSGGLWCIFDIKNAVNINENLIILQPIPKGYYNLSIYQPGTVSGPVGLPSPSYAAWQNTWENYWKNSVTEQSNTIYVTTIVPVASGQIDFGWFSEHVSAASGNIGGFYTNAIENAGQALNTIQNALGNAWSSISSFVSSGIPSVFVPTPVSSSLAAISSSNHAVSSDAGASIPLDFASSSSSSSNPSSSSNICSSGSSMVTAFIPTSITSDYQGDLFMLGYTTSGGQTVLKIFELLKNPLPGQQNCEVSTITNPTSPTDEFAVSPGGQYVYIASPLIPNNVLVYQNNGPSATNPKPQYTCPQGGSLSSSSSTTCSTSANPPSCASGAGTFNTKYQVCMVSPIGTSATSAETCSLQHSQASCQSADCAWVPGSGPNICIYIPFVGTKCTGGGMACVPITVKSATPNCPSGTSYNTATQVCESMPTSGWTCSGTGETVQETSTHASTATCTYAATKKIPSSNDFSFAGNIMLSYSTPTKTFNIAQYLSMGGPYNSSVLRKAYSPSDTIKYSMHIPLSLVDSQGNLYVLDYWGFQVGNNQPSAMLMLQAFSGNQQVPINPFPIYDYLSPSVNIAQIVNSTRIYPPYGWPLSVNISIGSGTSASDYLSYCINGCTVPAGELALYPAESPFHTNYLPLGPLIKAEGVASPNTPSSGVSNSCQGKSKSQCANTNGCEWQATAMGYGCELASSSSTTTTSSSSSSSSGSSSSCPGDTVENPGNCAVGLSTHCQSNVPMCPVLIPISPKGTSTVSATTGTEFGSDIGLSSFGFSSNYNGTGFLIAHSSLSQGGQSPYTELLAFKMQLYNYSIPSYFGNARYTCYINEPMVTPSGASLSSSMQSCELIQGAGLSSMYPPLIVTPSPLNYSENLGSSLTYLNFANLLSSLIPLGSNCVSVNKNTLSATQTCTSSSSSSSSNPASAASSSPTNPGPLPKTQVPTTLNSSIYGYYLIPFNVVYSVTQKWSPALIPGFLVQTQVPGTIPPVCPPLPAPFPAVPNLVGLGGTNQNNPLTWQNLGSSPTKSNFLLGLGGTSFNFNQIAAPSQPVPSPVTYIKSIVDSNPNLNSTSAYLCTQKLTFGTSDSNSVTLCNAYTAKAVLAPKSNNLINRIEGGQTFLQYINNNYYYEPNLSDKNLIIPPVLDYNQFTNRLFGEMYINSSIIGQYYNPVPLVVESARNYTYEMISFAQIGLSGTTYNSYSVEDAVPVKPVLTGLTSGVGIPTGYYQPVPFPFYPAPTFSYIPSTTQTYLNITELYRLDTYKNRIYLNMQNSQNSAGQNLMGYNRFIYTYVDRFNNIISMPLDVDFANIIAINMQSSEQVDPNNGNQTAVSISGNVVGIGGSLLNVLSSGNMYLYYDANLNYYDIDQGQGPGLGNGYYTAAQTCAFGLPMYNCSIANPLASITQPDCSSSQSNEFSKYICQAQQIATGYQAQDSGPNIASTVTFHAPANCKPPINSMLQMPQYNCNIYGYYGLPTTGTLNGFKAYCSPDFVNGTGTLTTEMGLMAVVPVTNGQFSYSFNTCGTGTAKVIAVYYGDPAPEPQIIVQTNLSYSTGPNQFFNNVNDKYTRDTLEYSYVNAPNSTAISFPIGSYLLSFGNINAADEIAGVALLVVAAFAIAVLVNKKRGHNAHASARRHKGQAANKGKD